MNTVTENAPLDQKSIGLYKKFNVTRTDGKDQPGAKHENDEYFVLNLTSDANAVPALAAYAEACQEKYPALADDLRKKVMTAVLADSEFVPVPETTLPNGHVEPAFLVARYLSSKGPAGIATSNPTGAPWVEINYHDARKACEAGGGQLITETQWLAIAWNISQQPENWTSGVVGEGSLFQGLHTGSVDEPQPGSYESEDAAERRWFVLSNGEKIFDFAGNAYSWVFDNVQGDEAGLIAEKFTKESPSISTAPYPSKQKGVGWPPSLPCDWSGYALIRGGCWDSVDYAGVFYLSGVSPDYEYDYVGFRSTKSLG